MAKKEQRFIKVMEDSGFISTAKYWWIPKPVCSISTTPWAIPAG